jgi:DNA (cytosine-5)-methyltransferase 1
MEKIFYKKGYQIKLHTLEARNFGVLQNRKRIIITWLAKKQKD